MITIINITALPQQCRRNLGEWGWSCFLSWSNKSDILKKDYDKELEQLEWSKCISKCTCNIFPSTEAVADTIWHPLRSEHHEAKEVEIEDPTRTWVWKPFRNVSKMATDPGWPRLTQGLLESTYMAILVVMICDARIKFSRRTASRYDFSRDDTTTVTFVAWHGCYWLVLVFFALAATSSHAKDWITIWLFNIAMENHHF